METREVVVAGTSVRYHIKKRRYQRRVHLIVHQDGSLVVTAPQTCSVRDIERSLQENAAWVIKNVAGKQKNVTIDDAVVRHVKNSIRPIILSKLEEFNRYYNFTYNRVCIRNQRSRWGSCSSNGNLNFNCKLLCVRDELRDYVVVHELCHLQEMNHSKKFWALVSETVPHYRELRKELHNITLI